MKSQRHDEISSEMPCLAKAWLRFNRLDELDDNTQKTVRKTYK